MHKNTILGVEIPTESKDDTLEQIIRDMPHPAKFCHIVSLNPENIILSLENEDFRKALDRSQIRIIDGIGIIWAARVLGVNTGDKINGVDLMVELLKVASDKRLKVMLIGGKENIANKVIECQSKVFQGIDFKSAEAISDIHHPKSQEEDKIFSIVAAFKPHLVFVAFGSPWQELWIDKNSLKFGKSIVVGVGGAFDFLGGNVYRAPKILRNLGFEWLFRLLVQPWRWKRQLRLIKFIWLVIKQKLYLRE